MWADPRDAAVPANSCALRYALSFDDGAPRTVDAVAATGSDDGTTNTAWARNTSDDVNRTATTHTLARAGVHRLKFWAVDPTALVRRLLIDTGVCRRRARRRGEPAGVTDPLSERGGSPWTRGVKGP
ncbi:hypothetical protein [Streptomyces sennicomposti]